MLDQELLMTQGGAGNMNMGPPPLGPPADFGSPHPAGGGNTKVPPPTESQMQQMATPVLNLLPGGQATGAKGGERRVNCPIREFPGYNFVGRILGPRGSTLKGLEAQYNVRIFIRGKGSEKPEEEARKRGKPGYEHL